MGERSSKMSSPVVVNALAEHTATVIFLHGLGDTGHGWASSLAAIGTKHIKYVCPTAPTMPVSLNAGFRMPSWFDLKSLEIDQSEDAEGIRRARDNVHQLIEKENRDGIPYNRIILGGFSQGGALALFSSLTFNNTLAGVVALSCWLPLRDEFPGNLKCNGTIPILQCHGQSDPVVPFKYGELTSQLLKTFAPNSEFKMYRNLGHSSSEEELDDVKKFLLKVIPPQSS